MSPWLAEWQLDERGHGGNLRERVPWRKSHPARSFLAGTWDPEVCSSKVPGVSRDGGRHDLT